MNRDAEVVERISNWDSDAGQAPPIWELRHAVGVLAAAGALRGVRKPSDEEQALLQRAQEFRQLLEHVLPSDKIVRILFDARDVLRVVGPLPAEDRLRFEWAHEVFQAFYYRYHDFLARLVRSRRLRTPELSGHADEVAVRTLTGFYVWLIHLDELPELPVEQMLRVRANSQAIDRARWLMGLSSRRKGTRSGEEPRRRYHHATEEQLDLLQDCGAGTAPQDLADPSTPVGKILARFTPDEQSLIRADYEREEDFATICREHGLTPCQANRILDRFRAAVLREHPRTDEIMARRFAELESGLTRTRGAASVLAALRTAWAEHRGDDRVVLLFRNLRRAWRHLSNGTRPRARILQSLRWLLTELRLRERSAETPRLVRDMIAQLERLRFEDRAAAAAVRQMAGQVRAELDEEERKPAEQSRFGLKLLRLVRRAKTAEARPTLEALARLRLELLAGRQRTPWERVVPVVVDCLREAAAPRPELHPHLEPVAPLLRARSLAPARRPRVVVGVHRLTCRLARNHDEPAEALTVHLRRLRKGHQD